jgi:hypothetical protein
VPSRSRAERPADQGHSPYDDALRRHRRHVLAVRAGAIALGALVLFGTFRAITFRSPSSAEPDGAEMSSVAAAATAAVPGTSLLQIDTESSDTWQVTVADVDGRCWLVRVARAEGSIGALPPPAIVACPPRVAAEADPGPEAEPGSDVDLVARGFVEAYLTASASVRRYLAPDIEMELPKPVRSVTVDRVRSRPVDGGEIASVSATADGTLVGYRLRLVEVEGRLWVEDLFAGPYIGTLTTEPANLLDDGGEVGGGAPSSLASDTTGPGSTGAEGTASTSTTAAPGATPTTDAGPAGSTPGEGQATTTTAAPSRPTLPPDTATSQPPGPGE